MYIGQVLTHNSGCMGALVLFLILLLILSLFEHINKRLVAGAKYCLGRGQDSLKIDQQDLSICKQQSVQQLSA